MTRCWWSGTPARRSSSSETPSRPSGLDDYCLQNRNFLRAGTGYSYCLDLLTSKIPAEALLINEHVVEPFRFDADQLRHLKGTLPGAGHCLQDLFPWDEPDFGIDEQWARIYPYGQEIQPERWTPLAVKLLNHSHSSNTFVVTMNATARLRDRTPPECR